MMNDMMNHEALVAWLREEDPAKLEELYQRADAVRRASVGDAVHLRGLLEISNHCQRECAYCGLNRHNDGITRYRMTTEEVRECVLEAAGYGYGTVVLQAGEDYGLTADWISEMVRWIKGNTALAVTLSLGERSEEELAAWRRAGADRYLLRFETSDRALYDKIHPPLPGRRSDRIAQLRRMREIGYEIGSGVMVGIPGQTYDSLANDIALFHELDLDMIGIGPYLPHPATPLARMAPAPAGQQAPNAEEMTYKMLALTRLACPQANLPSTTALATVNTAQGREFGLMRGANIVMPNVTPAKYRVLYEIYPGKACINETARQCQGCMRRRIESIGRHVGAGPGGRKRASA